MNKGFFSKLLSILGNQMNLAGPPTAGLPKGL